MVRIRRQTEDMRLLRGIHRVHDVGTRFPSWKRASTAKGRLVCAYGDVKVLVDACSPSQPPCLG